MLIYNFSAKVIKLVNIHKLFYKKFELLLKGSATQLIHGCSKEICGSEMSLVLKTTGATASFKTMTPVPSNKLVFSLI